MYPENVDPKSGCRLPLPRREQLDYAGLRTYDSLADPKGGTIRGLRGPGGILLHSPELSRHARPLNHYLRREAGLGGRVRELAILTTARELDSQLEWAAHVPEALSEGISLEIIEIIKHRKGTNGLDEADTIVIELGREIFGARKVASATFVRSLRQFGRRALVDLVALMGNYAGTAALLTAGERSGLDASPPAPRIGGYSLGNSRSIARFRRIPCLSGSNSQPTSS
jgi:4-carboxymuconolactone decarboxylase